MSYNNVEAHGSGKDRGPVVQAIIFAVYLSSLVILAILSVPFPYFMVIAVLGLPATGILTFLRDEKRADRWERLQEKAAETASPVPTEAIHPVSATDSVGRPVIHL